MTLEELNSEKSIDLRNILDLAIRNSKIGANSSNCGYQSKNGKRHINYMSNVAWEEYISNLKDHRKCFKLEIAGDPPKMASYGSSSQMTYELFKDKSAEFEKSLETIVGGKAKLDVYINTDNRDIYVEAKRREIYGDYSTIEASDKYANIYQYIHENHNAFAFSSTKSNKQGQSKYSFKYNGKPIEHFDIKQLICHFLGISADIINNTKTKPVRFLYLIFNPYTIESRIDERYRQDILDIYDITRSEIDSVDPYALFKVIFDYQSKLLNKKVAIPNFEFRLESQDTFEKALK